MVEHVCVYVYVHACKVVNREVVMVNSKSSHTVAVQNNREPSNLDRFPRVYHQQEACSVAGVTTAVESAKKKASAVYAMPTSTVCRLTAHMQ